MLAFLRGARVGRGIPSDDVQDAQQLQDVLHAAGVLAAARLGLGHFPGHAQDLAALIGRDGTRAETARAAAHAVLAHVLEKRGGPEQRTGEGGTASGVFTLNHLRNRQVSDALLSRLISLQ